LRYNILRASAQGRFFDAVVKLPRRPIYFLAVRTDGERNPTFSHFANDLVQSVCALHKQPLNILCKTRHCSIFTALKRICSFL